MEIPAITIEQRTVDLLRLFIRDFDEFRGKWLEVKSPWNLWAVHAHCDVITTSGVPFASKYSRLTRDCSVAGNKRTRKRACRCCNMERDFFLFVWYFFLSVSVAHFVGIKEYYGKGGLKMQESREWEGKLFTRTRNNALILRNIWVCSPSLLILYYTHVYMYMYTCYFQTRVLNFWRDFFFSIYYTIKMLRGLNNCTLMYYCLFLRFSMFVSLKYELKTRTSLLNFQKLNFFLSNCSRVTVTSFYLNNSFDKVKKLI